MAKRVGELKVPISEELKISGWEESEQSYQKGNTRQYHKSLQSINRVLDTLGACHRVLVQANNKSELIQEICHAIVTAGGYQMAWVGIARDDKDKSIQPLGYAGDVDGYLGSIRATWRETSKGLCPAGMAICSGKPYIVKNILNDPQVMPWRGEALKRGYASVVALPLISRKRSFGSLSIYTDEANIFQEKELNLLMGLADNIVYGIEALHNRIRRNRAEFEVKNSIEKLQKAFKAIVQVLEQTVGIRDPYTAGHQRRVSDLACAIAGEMGLSQDRIDGIRIAGIIHDIGKIHVPAEILSKPRSLSCLEFNLVKTHPQIGYDVLKAIDFPWPIAKIVLQHHERIDGSGYPNQLSKNGILLEAKVIGVADVVEAMASHRPYRPALGITQALREISDKRGTLYEAFIVDACLKVFNEKNFEFKESALEF